MPPKQQNKKQMEQGTREAHVRATALHHARLIQDQKDLQNKILDTIIEFVDLPSSPTADPGRPSPADVSSVKQGFPPFQQRDYDDLITERNISDKCGYVLCPRPNKKENTTATDRIIWSKKNGSDLKIVPRAELERWCSQACAERAIFLKAQLNESPAWVTGVKKDAILLLDEVQADRSPPSSTASSSAQAQSSTSARQEPSRSIVDGIRQLAIRDGMSADDEEMLRKIQQLALERGKAIRGGAKPDQDVTLVEKKTKGIARPPVAERQDAGSIEGYRPGAHGKNADDDDGQDILDI